MSIIRSIRQKCAACGEVHQYTVLCSTNSFGSPDLDMRPSEMARSSMRLWVQECPDCGYVADDIEDKPIVSRQYLQAEEFRSCEGRQLMSDLAQRFYKDYLLKWHAKNLDTALQSIICAAWASDDVEDVVGAKECRMVAADLAARILSTLKENREPLLLIRADLLRRSGQFSELQTEYGNLHFSSDDLNSILFFQITKASEGNEQCYTIADAQASLVSTNY